MAEIDKALPNVKQKLNIPSPEDIQVEEAEQVEAQVESLNKLKQKTWIQV